MFMEQFSSLPRMVEIVAVTHALLIWICPVLFSGLQTLEEQGVLLHGGTAQQNSIPPGKGSSRSQHQDRASLVLQKGNVPLGK